MVCAKEHGNAADRHTGLHIRRKAVCCRTCAVVEDHSAVFIACNIQSEIACGILAQLCARPCCHRLGRSAVAAVNISIDIAPVIGSVIHIDGHCFGPVFLGERTLCGSGRTVGLCARYRYGNGRTCLCLAADGDGLGACEGTGITLGGGVRSRRNIVCGECYAHGIRKAAACGRYRNAAARRRSRTAVIENCDTGISDMTCDRGRGYGKGTAAYFIGVSACRNDAAAVRNGNILCAAARINDNSAAASADNITVAACGQVLFLTDHSILELVDFCNLLRGKVCRAFCAVHNRGMVFLKRSGKIQRL